MIEGSSEVAEENPGYYIIDRYHTVAQALELFDITLLLSGTRVQ
jgi:hypothetical protein